MKPLDQYCTNKGKHKTICKECDNARTVKSRHKKNK